MDSSNATGMPIAIMDSGIGGLSVLSEIRNLLPQEALIYIADSAYAPYGERSAEQILARCQKIADWADRQGCKALVLACNTATAYAADELRAAHALPIIAMEPAIKPAVKATQTGVIGVLATTATLASERYARLLREHGPHVRVVSQACPGLAECIERGDWQGAALQSLLSQYLRPLLDAGADTIILGCTHYPLVRAEIECIVGSDVSVIDSGAAVAAQVQRRLGTAALLSSQRMDTATKVYVKEPTDPVRQLIRSVAGQDVSVIALNDLD